MKKVTIDSEEVPFLEIMAVWEDKVVPLLDSVLRFQGVWGSGYINLRILYFGTS
jgi:hypothetical protein